MASLAKCPICGAAMMIDTDKREWGGVRVVCFNGHDNIRLRETDKGDILYPGYKYDSRQNPGNYAKATDKGEHLSKARGVKVSKQHRGGK